MFGKKVCKNCGERIGSKGNFCSACGRPLGKLNDSDYGMLGKDDFSGLGGTNDLSNSLFGGFGGKIVGKMFNNVLKVLEKEMEKNMKETRIQKNPNPNTNFELYINGKRVSPDKIKVSRAPKVVSNNLSKNSENLFFSKTKKDQFLALEKILPGTNLRRISDKVIYEVSLPGVQSLEDVSIVKLENSIEIKAVSEDKAYEKIIPVSMNLDNYYFENGILILEMIDSQNL